MMLALLATLFAALTYGLVALRQIVLWRFPDSTAARWMEIRDPLVAALVSRHASREAA
ncbi:hypothetical protein [Jannaschia formosa]|uniref:hypothetical protein n=1 Tax=Jannaschia formosa TaxID=2259592 RepID=UPI0014305212|nr:hypothetical protein [Jannaschia formosa]